MIAHLVAISGGIGAGKSVVSRILRTKGYEVYDCDSRARTIMDNSQEIKRRLCAEIHPEAVRTDGSINRGQVAAVVFSDPHRLAALNAIVHEAVRADIRAWRASTHAELAFIETAILYQSGLDRMVDEVWDVVVPEDVRIARVCLRDNTDPEAVRRRIASQRFTPEEPHPRVHTIINDDCHSLLLQIAALLTQK